LSGFVGLNARLCVMSVRAARALNRDGMLIAACWYCD
jgi:hypothetical protein